jgi:feruloyl-CoA synthase
MRELELAPRAVDARKSGGVWYLTSPQPLATPLPTLGDMLRRSAASAPDRDFLIERRGDSLRRVTWGEALAHAEETAAWLLGEGHTAVAALSGNSVDHALLMLGCFLSGIPFVPVSPAYSLLSQDFAKLKVVLGKVRPSLLFADKPDARGLDVARAWTNAATTVGKARPAALPTITPDQVAKILFTSGSTGFPKGVPNTHRMLTANQQMIAQCWPFLEAMAVEEPPVLVDWLPWSHTFGGNHNFNMILAHAGTLFVDEGRPMSVDASIRNLLALPPTFYFNVPAGYAALVPKLEADRDVARAFFSRLRVIFYAAAALPADLWKRLVALSRKHAAHEVWMTTAWGSTETSPLATSAYFRIEEAGNIGLPAPGVTLKLVPSASKLEVRVKGPNVMTGYLHEPELTKDAFDEEGFYKIGDAVKLAEPEDPSRGLLFDGRVAEDFKLSSGTWVSVTSVRTGLVAAAGGVLADVVVCGHDRDHLGVLAWPSPMGCRALTAAEGIDALSVDQAVLDFVREVLVAWNRANPSSSLRISRALLLGEPPSIDAGEITDKGYTNQRVTIERRASVVAELFGGESARVIVLTDDGPPRP